MEHPNLELKNPHPSLHNIDLAPLPREKRIWGGLKFSTFGQTTYKVCLVIP